MTKQTVKNLKELTELIREKRQVVIDNKIEELVRDGEHGKLDAFRPFKATPK